jgi:predicted Zn-dependent peptidase
MNYVLNQFDNGMRVVVARLTETKAVSARLWLTGGSRAETASQDGIAHFLEHAVFKGTEFWPTSRALSAAVESVGGSADAFTDKDHSGFVIHGPSTHLPLFLDVLADLVRRPLLDPVEINRERSVIEEEISVYHDDADDLAKTTIESVLWPDHPLGREILGTEETLRTLTRVDLLDHCRRWFTPRAAVVSVASPLEPDAVIHEVRRVFGDWCGEAPPTWAPAPPPPRGPVVRILGRRAEQVRFRLAFPVPGRHAPHRHAIEVLATMLAGPAIARLELRLREELALAYDVSATLEQYDDTGALFIAAGVAPEHLEAALAAILSELASLRREAPPEEVKRIRDYLAGRWYCLEGTDFHASFAGRDVQVFGRPTTVEAEIEALHQVEPEVVRQLAEQIFVPEQTFMAVAGPWRRITPLRSLLSAY